MKKTKKYKGGYILALAGIFLVSGFLSQNVKASEYSTDVSGVVDFGQGTAKLFIQGNMDQSMKGKKFKIYRVFNEENSIDNKSVNYTFVPEYENSLKKVAAKRMKKTPEELTEYMVVDYIQSLNTLPQEGPSGNRKNESCYSEFRYFIEELRNEIVHSKANGDLVTVNGTKKDNSIEVKGLKYGYYIVDEVSDVKGKHSAASLCMVNTANPESTLNIKSDYPQIIKKIREDDNIESIGNDGWNDIGDYEIGQKVSYKFSSVIPNISGYDTYYYAWHDRMDEALTFCPDSVKVEITDPSTQKKYVLSSQEYTVQETLGQEETFVISISDIKNLLDNHFYEKNKTTEHLYGQEVTVSYQAVLNDKAAENTGRPGFENDVQLEFSNNPDSDGKGSTGKTPWDTVVCFTYKLNGLKQNEDQLPLEGAQFILYSDQECKNEVYVKKADSCFIVINKDSSGSSRPKEATIVTSDEKGKFVIAGLDGGVYYLKEKKAPAGYRLIKEPIKIEVKPVFTSDRNSYVKGDGALDKTLISLEYSAYIKQFLKGLFKEDTLSLQTDVENGTGNMTVINYKGKKLPATGSSLTLLIMGICVAFGVVTFLTRKQKKDFDEEQ